MVKSGIRQCSRNGCRNAAVATLTYVYKDQTAVLGPLAASAEPHTYDLCATHSERLTAPRGWEVVRLDPDIDTSRNDDDIAALADAVREAAFQGRLPEGRRPGGRRGPGGGPDADHRAGPGHRPAGGGELPSRAPADGA